jgi:hypothetical protein
MSPTPLFAAKFITINLFSDALPTMKTKALQATFQHLPSLYLTMKY